MTANHSRDQFAIAFGRRLRNAVNSEVGGHASRLDFERVFSEEVLQSTKGRSDVFRRWYAGSNLPSIYVLNQLIERLNQPLTNGLDANYILMGRTTAEPDIQSSFAQLMVKLDIVLEHTRFLRNYTEDHEFGIEGVVMRQTIRLLQDLTSSRKQDKNDDDREQRELLNLQVAGILTDDLLEIVESSAIRMRLIPLTLDYLMKPEKNFIANTDSSTDGSLDIGETTPATNGPTTSHRPGRMLNVVTNNLRRGCRYEYLLPGTEDKRWPVIIRTLKNKLVKDRFFSHTYLDKHLRFGATDLPIGTGFGLIDFIDTNLLSKREALAKELRGVYTIPCDTLPLPDEYQPGDHKLMTLGFAMPPAEKTHACMLMDMESVAIANKAWIQYKNSSIPLTLRS